MKKKKTGFKVAVSMATLCSMLIGLTACGDGHTHTYGEWQTITPATCTADGERKRECSCGDVQTEKVTASGHTYSEKWSSNETQHWHECTACGEKKDVQNHSMSDKSCSVCGKLESTQGLEFTFNDQNGYSVSGIGTATDTDIVIPTEYNGLPVTSIDTAFEDCTNLTSVTIQDSVTRIGPFAFSGCSGLTDITIPDSVISVRLEAFKGCNNLIETENGIKYVKNWAIDCDTSLTQATLRNGTKGLADYTFLNCKSLTSVTLPEGLTSIGTYSFENCSALTSLTIPDSVIQVDTLSFEGCEKLIEVEDGLNYVDNWVIGSTDFSFTKITEANIRSGTRGIAVCTFFSCANLTSVNIPDSVISICASAFSECGLTSVNIPSSVKYIIVDEGAVFDCLKMQNITVDENNEIYKSIDGNLYSKDGKTLIQYALGKTASGFTIPDSVTNIEYGAFGGCNSLTSMSIPNNVTVIGDYAFSNCGNLKSIVMGDGVKIIGNGAFWKSENLESVTLGSEVTTICYRAFYDCEKLSNISISRSVKQIGDYAFYGCSSLANVSYNGSEEDWAKISIGEGNDSLTDAIAT